MSDNPSDPYAAPQTPGGQSAAARGIDKDQRMWAMFAHLASLAVYIFPFAGNIIGPLIVWLIKKDEMPFVDDQGKESINFQITVTILHLVAVVLVCTGVGIFLVPIVLAYALIMAVIAAIKANEGVYYRYPLTLRLLT